MLTLAHDARVALRGLRRRLATTVAATLALALGIGATTAIFSVLDGVLLRPLPFAEAERLVTVWQTFPHWRGEPTLDAQWDRIALDWPTYERLRARATTLDGIAAYRTRESTLLAGEVAERAVAGRATASLLPLLGVRVQRGRWLLPDDEGPGGRHVAVISDALWRGRFGGDAAVLGRTVTVDDAAYTVIGVLPPGFRLAGLHPYAPAATPHVWTPIGLFDGELQPGNNSHETMARLRADVPAARADAELRTVAIGDRDTARHGARIVPRLDAETAGVRDPLRHLAGAVLLLLLLACANVAVLLVGESAGREAEMTVRAALGASRWRIARLLLVESLLLALLGAALGVALAAVGTRLLLDLAPAALPRAADVGLSVRALGVALAAAMGTGLLFGMLPALSLACGAARLDRRDGRHATRARARALRALVAAQLALCTLLLAAGGLLARSLLLQQAVAPGFDAARLLTLRVTLPRGADVERFVREASADLAGIPGVAGAAFAGDVPFGDAWSAWSVDADPSVRLSLRSPSMLRTVVQPGWFELLGMRLLDGRFPTAADGADAPRVAVVDSTMAARLWPGRRAVGRELRAPSGVLTVVGVVADVRTQALDERSEGTFFMPLAQTPTRSLTLSVRTRVPPAALLDPVRRALAEAAPAAPISDVATMDERIRRSLADERYRSLLVGAFAAMAVLLAVVGIAGLASRTASQRLRELAIRMALGATPAAAGGLVVRLAVGAAALGVGAGVLGVLAAGRVLQRYLYGVPWWDPATLGGAAALLLLCTLLATLAPARRVGRVELARVLAREG